MIPVETLLLFLSASVALAMAPGPDNIFVLTQSALYGRKAGIWVTLGLCSGLLFHTALVAFGVAALIQTSATAFSLLKIAGALYLLYLAFKALKAGSGKLNISEGKALTGYSLYKRGIIMNITNPKVAIFFLAFLPQFTAPEQGAVTLQIMVLGALFIISALLVFGMIAWFAGFLGERLKHSEKAQVILNRMTGVIFIGLALRLAVTER